jgi:hypothetical protein
VRKTVKVAIKSDLISATKCKIPRKAFPILEQQKLINKIIKSNNMRLLTNSMDLGCTGNSSNFNTLKEGLTNMSKEKQQEI